MALPPAQALRRGVLAVAVLHDVDLQPADDGVDLPGAVPVHVSWAECTSALAGSQPDSTDGQGRLAGWLLARRWLADHHLGDLAERARPVGLPVSHTIHPGPAWVRHAVPGGALDLGLGLLGLDPAQPDSVVVLPEGVWAPAGIDPAPWWTPARAYLAAMCRLAVDRRRRSPDDGVRPMGNCDPVTLLGCGDFRSALVGSAGGMAAVGAPMRDRVWTDLRRVDPAFVVAAAAATDPDQRGFPRPLLVTADEVTLVGAGGRPARDLLRETASDGPRVRPVRYR